MASAPSPALSKQRILLVDDDEDDYILTHGMLVDSGRDKFQIDWASTYAEGLDRLLTGNYAAALVDYDLGAKKGTELIETALAKGCQTPMIVYTGRGSYDVDVQSMRSGAADYVNKAEASPALLERSIRYAIERKHSEQALQTALSQAEGGRRTLEAVMRNVPVGIILTGGPPEFRIEQVSRYVVELTGRPLYRLTGLPIGQHQDNWRLFLADGKTRPKDSDLPIYRAAHWGETNQNKELVLIGARGRRISILASAAPIRDRHGQIIAAIGVFHDITDRKKTEQDLRRERELLQTLVDSIPVMLTFYDPAMKSFRFNREFERLIGWTTEEAQTSGLDLMAEFYPDPAYRKMVGEFMTSLEEGWRDFDVTTRDGSVMPSSWSNVRISDDTQIGIGIDLRDRLQAERAVAESEAVLRGFFETDSVMSGIIELDSDDLIYVMTNPKLAAFFGQKPETISGRRASQLGFSPQTVAALVAVYRQCLETRAPVEWEHQLTYRSREGWYLGTVSQIPSGPSGLPRFALVVVDISDRKRWEARTRQQNAVLDAINRIFQEALTANSEEELGMTCLTVAQELTQSPMGFVGEISATNRMEDAAGDATGWIHCEQCLAQGKDHMPAAFEPRGLFGRVLKDGQSLLTNDPPHHTEQSGLPGDHPPLSAFLGVPLVQGGKTVGLIAVGNRAEGYRDADREALEALAPAVVEAFARKRTEQALRESEERFRIALANTPVVIFTMDRALRYTWIYNPRKDFTVEGTLGKRDEDLLDPESARLLTGIKQQVLDSGQGVHQEAAYRINGTPVVYDLTIEPLRGESGEVIGLIAAAMDVTNVRQIETEMRSAADRLEIQRQILQHREQERMQIARDMHDGLLQELIGLTYMLREGLDINEKNARVAKFTEIMAVLQAQIQEVRAFCSTLRPPTLIPFGLERSINQFAAGQMEKYPELHIELDLMKDGRSLPEDLRMALFRIVQESINNARKHAQAQQVQVRFAFDEQEIVLEVQDDGVGFEVPSNWLALSRRGHLGLVGIHERAEAVGGRLQVISAPGAGTRVLVTVPRKVKS